MNYFPRLVDKEIDDRIKAFNAINIVGPKGCGKTRTIYSILFPEADGQDVLQ